MKAVFMELPAFARHRPDYLDDDAFRQLQLELMRNPLAGDVMRACGGLRKLRFHHGRRNKGKRGGIRVIYYWYAPANAFWLFAIYGKDDMSDLTETQRHQLAEVLKHEISQRQDDEA